jgi:hypothetical protein
MANPFADTKHYWPVYHQESGQMVKVPGQRRAPKRKNGTLDSKEALIAQLLTDYDMKRKRTWETKEGFEAWKEKHPKSKYHVEDTDYNNDGIPEVTVKDAWDRPVAINGYHITKSDWPYRTKMLHDPDFEGHGMHEYLKYYYKPQIDPDTGEMTHAHPDDEYDAKLKSLKRLRDPRKANAWSYFVSNVGKIAFDQVLPKNEENKPLRKGKLMSFSGECYKRLVVFPLWEQWKAKFNVPEGLPEDEALELAKKTDAFRKAALRVVLDGVKDRSLLGESVNIMHELVRRTGFEVRRGPMPARRPPSYAPRAIEGPSEVRPPPPVAQEYALSGTLPDFDPSFLGRKVDFGADDGF